MKKHLGKSIVSTLLSAALLAISPLSAFADDFTLRNGILFGDSLATVESKETLPFSTDEGTSDDGIYHIWTEEGTISGLDGAKVAFWFSPEDELIEMKYDFDDYSSRDSVRSHYEDIYDGLCRKYGDPLPYSGGDTHLITTMAITSAVTLAGLYEAIGGAGDYIDYNEWIVDCDGYHVKIDIISYYYGSSYSEAEYSFNVGYKKFTDEDLQHERDEKQNKQDTVDNDL